MGWKRGFGRGLAAALTVAVVATGCKTVQTPKYGSVTTGVEIPLMLIMNLESGADAVGTVVPFVCKGDVVDSSGNVVIAEGSIAYGKVVLSHGAKSAGAGPIALQVSIDDIQAVDGTKVKLSSIKNGVQTSPLALTGSNTATIRKSDSLDRAWGTPDVHAHLVKLVQFVHASKNSSLADNPETANLLLQLSEELALPHASRLRGNDLLKVADMVGQIGTGRLDLEVLPKAPREQIGSVIELTQAVGYAEDRLAKPAGSTIRARVGLPFTAYVIEAARVRLPSSDRS